jgi:cytochrome c553
MRTSIREPIVRFIVKHPWITAIVLGTAIAIGATFVVVSGIVPIRASSGHWSITARLLDFAKLQSVKTYSLGIDPPPLDDEALAIRGAAHYALACESCHGSPDNPVPPVMAAMTPPPPELTGERLTRWTPAQLFSIVKHGIKFTGMPAWPVQQRDDEVWAVVTFLIALPDTNAAEYRRLIGLNDSTVPVGTTGQLGPPTPVQEICVRCHGADGTGREGAFPSLAGQRMDYMVAALRAFKDRSRHSATMSEVAARLSDTEMREAAVYYERLPARVIASPFGQQAASRGQVIATRGSPERNIPACAECHGPSETPRSTAYPKLTGQHSRYLVQQLELLKQRRRGGSPRVNLMHEVVDDLGPVDVGDVARYYASLSHDAP